MMGEGRRADVLQFMQAGALHRVVALADLLQDLHTARFGKHTGDASELLICQADILRYVARSEHVKNPAQAKLGRGTRERVALGDILHLY